MSATGRGMERREADFYPTPSWCVQRLLDYYQPPRGRWLEPSAGEGHIIRALLDRFPTRRVDAFEIRPECRGPLEPIAVVTRIEDFLRAEPPIPSQRYSLSIGNPPYLTAQTHIEHSLKWANEAIALLSVGFLASAKRQGFFRKYGEPDLYILPERPSFTDGGTDSCTYAWMRWQADGQQAGIVTILYDKRQLELIGGES